MDEAKRPKLKRDWQGAYVRSRREFVNGAWVFPQGTIFKVEDSGIGMYLRSLPCPHCGLAARVTLKGKGTENLLDYLGKEGDHKPASFPFERKG